MSVVLLSSNAFATLDEISNFLLKPLSYSLVERFLSLIYKMRKVNFKNFNIQE
jgi:hypothetical protein